MHKCLLVIQDIFAPEKQHFMLTGLRQQTLKTCTHERSPSRLSESHSGWFFVTTPPLFFFLKASPKSTFYPDWRWWRCNRLRVISSTSECLAASAQTWTPPPPSPIELSPLGRSLLCWLIKYWQECGYTMNVEQGVDRGGFCSQQQRRLMVHESLRLFPSGGRNTHITPSIRNHVRFMFHSNGLHGTTAGFQLIRGRRDRRAQREVTFAPAEKTTAKRRGNKRAEVGKDEMHEHIVMRSWKQKP